MTIRLSVTVTDPAEGRLIAPLGLRTPHLCPDAFEVEGAPYRLLAEAQTGQWVAVIDKGPAPVRLSTRFRVQSAPYPEEIFAHRPNRYTRAAQALAEGAQELAARAGGGMAGLLAIVEDTRAQFTYGHVDTAFYADTEDMPQLCGLTQGSCVDINAYLIASLRAAGYEAGYVTGYFIPAEKRVTCNDMHCWVLTRHQGVVQEWDIAHILKMGRDKVDPGLNPKPGVRVPMAHSMGLDLPELGLHEMKLLSQPRWVDRADWPEVDIRLDGYDLLAAL